MLRGNVNPGMSTQRQTNIHNNKLQASTTMGMSQISKCAKVSYMTNCSVLKSSIATLL